MSATESQTQYHGFNLRKVLGPVHVWGLGAGICLVGEFMGWNFAVGKGGALWAFNVALYLVLAYTMLEAGNAFVAADLLKTLAAQTGHPNLDSRPFVLLVIVGLSWLNCRGVFETLTFNYVISAIVFLAILVLFFGTEPFSSDGL